MKSIQDLREERGSVAREVKAFMDTNKATWTRNKQKIYDAKMVGIDSIDDQIKRIEDYNNIAAEKALNGNNTSLIDKHTKEPARQNAESIAFKNFLAGGMRNLDNFTIARLRARQTPDIRAAMSVGVGSEGGFTVATEFYRKLTESFKMFGGIRSVATVMPTETGAKMSFPASDATAEEGEIVGENAAVTALDTTFNNIDVDVHKYSSKKIAIPFELLGDSMFDLEAYIRELLAIRIGRITSKHFTTGTGTGQPNGLITATTAGKIGGSGQTATVTYDDLVDLEHSIDPLYKKDAGFMMNDASIKAIRKIKDGDGRPVFVPGYETGVPGGAPDRLLGRPITISQEMPVMAANAKSITFGQMSKYIIREVIDLTIFRMADSGFLLNGQIGFVGFNRQGGNLIDAGAVKYYQNSAT